MKLEAFREFQDRIEPLIVASLVRRGASHALAQDIARDVLGDCSKREENSIQKFDASSHPEAWVTRVAINRLIDQQRRGKFRQDIDDNYLERVSSSFDNEEFSDPNLEELIAAAIRHAFSRCSPGEQVFLMLVYAHSVDQRKLARLRDWSDSKVSRLLTATRSRMREEILAYLKKRDPHLELGWNEVLSICIESGCSFISE